MPGSVVVKIRGATTFSAKLKDIAGTGKERDLGRALFAAGNLIEVEAARLITAGSVSGKGHVPSKPGEPPSNDTGVLARNIETVQVEPLKVEVSSNAPYSAALEYGTSKMLPRPFMTPATAAKKDEAIALVRRAVDHILAGGSVR
jgi:HK97 gp10 family phage protein